MYENSPRSPGRPLRKRPEYTFGQKAALVAGGFLSGVAATLGIEQVLESGKPVRPVSEVATPTSSPSATSTPIERMLRPTYTPQPTETAAPTETPVTPKIPNWEIFGMPLYSSADCASPLDPNTPHYRMHRIMAPLHTQPGYEHSVPDAMYTTQVVFEPVNPGDKKGDPQECFVRFTVPANIEIHFPADFQKLGIMLVEATAPDGSITQYQLDQQGIMPSKKGTMPRGAYAWVNPGGTTIKLFDIFSFQAFMNNADNGSITVQPINK